ncbi:sigma-70 family RNA polymerase sigma factor [Hungatella hathewayi]|nr:sigma-70 family RNA polymerase sigma factor [Hungatella hathewayi]
MDRYIHNIELFKSHTAPRHTAFRIHDPIGLFISLHEKVSVFVRIPPPLRSDGLTIELLNVSIRKAAVYAYKREKGCFLCFKVSARCRGPPFFKNCTKILENGGQAMWQRNSGQGEAEILQNRFTSYLVTAVNRRRKDYMNQQNKRLRMECCMEDEAWYLESDKQLHSNLPLLMQLENDALVSALKQITERERHVFLSHALEDKGFEELAAELGITYKGAAAIYYRTVQKIKRKMGEDRDVF